MKNFKTRVKIEAELSDVWAALTNPFTIELWSGYPAKMKDDPGFEFSLWNGDIVGRNIEVEPENLLIQEWYFGDQTEQSIVTFKLFEQGKKIQVDLTHTNIPDEAFEDICQGWEEYYLGNIKEFLEVPD